VDECKPLVGGPGAVRHRRRGGRRHRGGANERGDAGAPRRHTPIGTARYRWYTMSKQSELAAFTGAPVHYEQTVRYPRVHRYTMSKQSALAASTWAQQRLLAMSSTRIRTLVCSFLEIPQASNDGRDCSPRHRHAFEPSCARFLSYHQHLMTWTSE
jgi:hypothetical protein